MKKLSSKENLRINSYQKYINEMYENLNKDRTFHDLYAYVDRTSGYLCKAILLDLPDVKNFIRPISWIFSLSTKIGSDLEDAFLRRYPGICPYCLEPQCVCYKTDKKPPKYIPAYRMREEMDYKYEAIRNTVKVFNMDKAVKNIKNIFSVNEAIWHYAGAWHHIAKIHEEIAEVHEAFSSFQKGEKPLGAVSDEVADTFSWIIGAWGIVYPDKSLDDTIIDYYIDGCPVCSSLPCICEKYGSRPAGLVDYKVIINVKNKLDELAGVLPGYQDEIRELIAAYEIAVETQNEPTALLSISQTKDKLTKIKDMVSTTDDIGKKSFSIITTILSIIDKLSNFA